MNHMDELQQGFSQVMMEMSLEEIDAFAEWFNRTYPVIRDMTKQRMELMNLEVW